MCFCRIGSRSTSTSRTRIRGPVSWRPQDPQSVLELSWKLPDANKYQTFKMGCNLLNIHHQWIHTKSWIWNIEPRLCNVTYELLKYYMSYIEHAILHINYCILNCKYWDAWTVLEPSSKTPKILLECGLILNINDCTAYIKCEDLYFKCWRTNVNCYVLKLKC